MSLEVWVWVWDLSRKGGMGMAPHGVATRVMGQEERKGGANGEGRESPAVSEKGGDGRPWRGEGRGETDLEATVAPESVYVRAGARREKRSWDPGKEGVRGGPIASVPREG